MGLWPWGSPSTSSNIPQDDNQGRTIPPTTVLTPLPIVAAPVTAAPAAPVYIPKRILGWEVPREMDERFVSFMNCTVEPRIKPWARDPLPAYGLGSLYLATMATKGSGIPPRPAAALLALATYGGGLSIQKGDIHNGSSIVAMWAASYVLINGIWKPISIERAKKNGIVLPRSPFASIVTLASVGIGGLYAIDRLYFQKQELGQGQDEDFAAVAARTFAKSSSK